MSNLKPSTLVRAQHCATRRNSFKAASADYADILLPGHDLTQQQVSAIELLLRGFSDAKVAKRLGVDRGTVFRWRKQERFAAILHGLQKSLWRQSLGRLQSLLDPALDALQGQIAYGDSDFALEFVSVLLRNLTPTLMRNLQENEVSKQVHEAHEPRGDSIPVFIDAPATGEPKKQPVSGLEDQSKG